MFTEKKMSGTINKIYVRKFKNRKRKYVFTSMQLSHGISDTGNCTRKILNCIPKEQDI